MPARKLSSGEIHLLKLIHKGQNNNAWTKVSTQVLPLVKELPTELVELDTVKSGVPQYVRLTRTGRNIIDALNWL